MPYATVYFGSQSAFHSSGQIIFFHQEIETEKKLRKVSIFLNKNFEWKGTSKDIGNYLEKC